MATWWSNEPAMTATAFQFDQATHTYSENGAPIKSVTQIIQEFGLVNFDHVSPEVLARKAQLGRLVHQACHFFDENDCPANLHPEVEARLEAYKRFRRETGYQPEVNEFQQIGVVCGMKFGMQFDSIGNIPDGRHWIVDIKNAANVSRTWGLQLAAYDMAVAANFAAKALQTRRTRVAVQLFNDGRYKLHTFSDPTDYTVFQSLLAISTWKRNNKLA